MDVWDALKLVARRWYVSVPLIVLTLAAAVFTLVAVEPRHTSDGHIMLLPPNTEINPGEEDEEIAVNPWTTETLTAAIVTKLRNHTLFEQLAEEGYGGIWEVETDLQFESVVVIQVTSDSPADAQATVQRLLEVVETEIDEQQQPHQLPSGARITSLRLDGGENLAIARGNQARALVVVFGIGVILTLVITVCSDVLLRRRIVPGQPVPVSPAGVADRPAESPATATPHNGHGSAPARAPVVPQTPLPATATGAAQPGFTGATQPGIQVSYRPPPTAAPGSAPPASAEVEPAPEADVDETVVLPLARASWESKSRADDGGANGGASQTGRR